MIVGHLATALIPASKLRTAPIWLLMLCTMVQDFLWLGLIPFGAETVKPDSFLDATFKGMTVHMPYSHDLIPNLAITAAVGAAVLAIWRDKMLAIWCAGLVFVHFLCDLLAGFGHNFWGPESANLGLNLYQNAPHLGILIEAAFSAAVVAWFIVLEKKAGKTPSRVNQIILYAFFCGGALFWLPTATMSLRQVLGL